MFRIRKELEKNKLHSIYNRAFCLIVFGQFIHFKNYFTFNYFCILAIIRKGSGEVVDHLVTVERVLTDQVGRE